MVYIADLRICTKEKEIYYKHSEIVLERLQDSELYASPEKMNFAKKK